MNASIEPTTGMISITMTISEAKETLAALWGSNWAEAETRAEFSNTLRDVGIVTEDNSSLV